tara:strand:+ start:355 stop:2298 length:1944 start_codon:yes stop_codon:yes gene_type:complete
MTTNNYLYPNTINLSDSKSYKKSTYAFGIIGGHIKLIDDGSLGGRPKVDYLKWGNCQMKFFGYGCQDALRFNNYSIKLDNIQYNSVLTNAKFSKTNEIVNVVKSALYQAFAGSNAGPSDFYNNENLVLDVGGTLISTKELEYTILSKTIKTLNSSPLAQLGCGGQEGCRDENEILWFTYEYDIGHEQIKFTIGWIIEYVSNSYKINGTVYKPDTYDIGVWDSELSTKISETKSSNDGTFVIELQKPYDNTKLYISSLSPSNSSIFSSYFGFFSDSIILNPISTLIAEYGVKHKDLNIQNIKEVIYKKLGINNPNFNDKIIKQLEIMIEYTVMYIGKRDELNYFLAKCIYEGHVGAPQFLSLPNILSEFIIILEESYGIIDNGEIIYQQLFEDLINIENGKELQNKDFVKRVYKKRTSSHKFDYNIGLDQQLVTTTTSVDFIVHNVTEPGAFQFFPNDFCVQWDGSNPVSKNALSINFNINPHQKIYIIPNSNRAKKFAWLYDNNSHTMNTLYKGLFGELLISSGLVPTERTNDNLGNNGNEPYKGYITTESLLKNIVQSPNKYFENIIQKDITDNLTQYYRNLWTNDENSCGDLLINNCKIGRFLTQDIFEVPVNINMKYKLSGLWTKKSQRSIESSFSFLINFKVV